MDRHTLESLAQDIGYARGQLITRQGSADSVLGLDCVNRALQALDHAQDAIDAALDAIQAGEADAIRIAIDAAMHGYTTPLPEATDAYWQEARRATCQHNYCGGYCDLCGAVKPTVQLAAELTPTVRAEPVATVGDDSEPWTWYDALFLVSLTVFSASVLTLGAFFLLG